MDAVNNIKMHRDFQGRKYRGRAFCYTWILAEFCAYLRSAKKNTQKDLKKSGEFCNIVDNNENGYFCAGPP